MIWEFDFSSQKYPEIDDYSYFSETYNSEDLQLPFTIKGGVLIDLLVRLPPAFTLDCKGMPIDRSFHVVCHRHVIFDNLHSQNAQKWIHIRAGVAYKVKLEVVIIKD